MRRFRSVFVAFVLVLVGPVIGAQQSRPRDELHLPSGPIDLARLVDLASQRLSLRITYDDAALKSKATLRLPTSLSDQELWDLTNRLLAEQGLVTARLGGGSDPAIAVVKMAIAAQLMQAEPFVANAAAAPNASDQSGRTINAADPGINPADPSTPAAPVNNADPAVDNAESVPPSPASSHYLPSFRKLAVRLTNISPKDAAAAISPHLSKPGGSVVDEPASRTLIIADFRPHAEAAAKAALALDAPTPEIRIIEYACRNIAAAQLVTLASQVAAKREALGGASSVASSKDATKAAGELITSPGGRGVLIVAPANRVDEWLAVLGQLDQREAIETRRYPAGSLGATEAARLLEQTIAASRAAEPAGAVADDRWSAVADESTGTVLITGTPSQHGLAEQTLAGLAAAPPASRRPLKAFVLKHRSVREVIGIIDRLIDVGMLDGAGADEAAGQAGTNGGGLAYDPAAPDANASGLRAVPSAPTVAATPSTAAISVEPKDSPLLDGMTRGTRRSGSGGGRDRGRVADALTLTADEATNTLIAIGEPRVLAQLEKLLPTLDVRQSQVMIEAVLVSLSDAQTLALGVELEKIEMSGDTIIRLASLFGLSSAGAGANAGGRTVGDAAGFTGVVLNPGDFSVIVRALETVNQGRSLSVPRVLVNNNQQATFNSTLQQPYASTNASDTVATTSFGGTFDAGTTITVRPQIAEGDHLVLDYQVKLSSFAGAAGANLPPPRQENSVTSVATIPDGYTVVVGGLEAITEGDGESRVPGIGAIPILGELFKNRTKNRSRARFFVFLRANVMRGTAGTRFEELKYLSTSAADQAGLTNELSEGGWPELEPRVIR